MIPSNPSNSKPFIFRFFDSLGIAHLCAALDHTHNQSEVDGLTTALAGKASSSDMTTALAGKMDKMTVDEVPTSGSNNLVKSGGVFSALLNKVFKIIAPQSTSEKWAYVETEMDGDDGIIQLGVKSEEDEEGQSVDINHNNIQNLSRALKNPDNIPTVNSDKLITSGAVAAALEDQVRNLISEHGKARVFASETSSFGGGYIEIMINDDEEGEIGVDIYRGNVNNLARALQNPDSTPTESSDKLITSGAVAAALANIPVHQVIAILPKTSNQQSPYDAQSWLGLGKMAFVLQTSRPVRVYVDARGYNDGPDSTGRTESTDIYFDLQQGVRTVKNLYDLMSAALGSDYPDFDFTGIDQWKIAVQSLDTETDDTMCVINVYNPTSSE